MEYQPHEADIEINLNDPSNLDYVSCFNFLHFSLLLLYRLYCLILFYFLNGVHYIIFFKCVYLTIVFHFAFLIFVMCTSMRRILFKHLGELLRVKIHIRSLLQVCKSHPIWDLQPPMLVSHVEDLERQLIKIEDGIYKFQLELEVNLMKG